MVIIINHELISLLFCLMCIVVQEQAAVIAKLNIKLKSFEEDLGGLTNVRIPLRPVKLV